MWSEGDQWVSSVESHLNGNIGCGTMKARRGCWGDSGCGPVGITVAWWLSVGVVKRMSSGGNSWV